MLFSYQVYKEGKTTTGSLEAESLDAATIKLRSENYIIVKIEPQKQAITTTINNLFSRVSFSDVVDLTRQFAIMLSSGLTLTDAIEILLKQAKKPGYRKLLTDIQTDIKGGSSLSSALAKRKDLFSNFYVALVKAGEASGKLDSILSKLSDNLERQRQFRSKIKGAMIYPMIIVIAMLSVMFIMITFVIPQLLTIYQDFDVELPAATRILIALSNFFKQFWIFVIIGLVVGVMAFVRYYRTKKGRQTIDTIVLRLPIIGRVVTMSVLVDTTRTLSTLIGSGVSILEAIEISREVTNNQIYQKAFLNIYNRVEKGETLGKSLDEENIFPPILVQMTSVGEQTGHLDTTLMHLSNYFENESETAVKALTVLIEPAVLVVLGFSVGFVVIAVITPIFSLSNAF